MGYFFQNIGQLAGFFANQNEKGSSKNSAVQVSDTSFESIFDSVAVQSKNRTNDIAENGCFNKNIELVERTFLNEDILKALIEKQGNIVTLEISSDKISRYLDDLSLPAAYGKHGLALILANSSGNIAQFEIGNSAASTYRISFNTAGIFSRDHLPVEFINADGGKTSQLIDVTRLVKLIREYPEPVQAEIEIIPERENCNDLDELKSSFKFDLRNLLGTDYTKSSKPIEGLISLSAGQLSKSAFLRSSNITYNNRESSRNTAFIEKGEGPSENESFRADISRGLFQFGQKISAFLPGIKSYTPHGDGISHRNDNHIVPESSNWNESAGADDVKSSSDDNPSALSKIAVGSSAASKGGSAKINYGSLDGFTDHYEMFRGAMTKGDAENLKELPLRNLENLQDIKTGILDAIEHGRSTVRMRFHPENLGTLHVKLQWRAGSLITEFRVDNARAGDAVSAMLPELKASLEEANLKLVDVNVIVNDRGKEFLSSYNPQYYSGSAWNGPDKKGRSPFEGCGNANSETVKEKTDGIDNPGSRSIHRGWIDLKA